MSRRGWKALRVASLAAFVVTVVVVFQRSGGTGGFLLAFGLALPFMLLALWSRYRLGMTRHPRTRDEMNRK